MIEVQSLSKTYGDYEAISHLSFSVQKGSVVGFLGPNGAGKSTTMKIITGFMAPTSGVARVAGFDVFENPIEVKKRIGYLPETPPVYLDMTVTKYLRYAAELKGVEVNKLKPSVENAIAKTNLQSVQNRLIQNLSKGFRQRVGIAQAIVSNPEVLILDEPTVGLDPKQVAEIRELIKELRGQHTIILSTHILPEVQATCEHIIIIHRGKIVAQNSLEKLSQMTEGGQSIRLKVKQADPGMTTWLSKIGGVKAVKSSAAAGEFHIDADGREEIVEAIVREVLDKKVGLLEVATARADLEEIFLKLTYEGASKT